MRVIEVFIASGLVLIFCAVTPAINIYVDPINGNDANRGDSWLGPLKTITEASWRYERRSLVLHLAEGVFSPESGEIFPLIFFQSVTLEGISPEKTMIEPGTSATIIRWVGDSFVLSHLSLLGESMPGAAKRDQSMIKLSGGDVYIQYVHFMALQPRSRPILSLDLDMAMYLEDSMFIDCAGKWFDVGSESSPDIMIERCVFMRSSLNNDADAPTWPRSAWVADCRFQGPGCLEGFDPSGGLFYINCAFEDYYLEIFSGEAVMHAGGTYWPRREIIGCSFRNSTIQTHVYQGVDFEYCAFDPESELDIVDGSASVWGSCSSFTDDDPNDNFGLRGGIQADPMFVDGPLGGCYLSNSASGQMFSSPCLSWPIERYRGWPPEGMTTRTDGAPDEAPFDIGYHYPSVPPPPPKVAIRTDRAEYAAGDEMTVSMSYENRGVKVEGAVYFAFGPESLDWLVFWPWMTFVPTPFAEGTLWSGVSYPNLLSTSHTIPDSLAPGGYLWLGAVLNANGTFASDIALRPVSITPR